MKRLVFIFLLLTGLTLLPKPAQSQIAIAEIIKAGVKKVIKAVDLQVQRLQNKTIWLQNAQKTVENLMSKLKLTEISEWTERQRTLYKDYFDELNKVKSIIAYYNRIKEITQKQALLVKAYQRAWGLVRQDKHFTATELNYMADVYSGILEESLKNIDQIILVINSFQTQMSDAKRLEIINAAADKADQNYYDLTQFTTENVLLSLQRAKSEQDVFIVKSLYGLK